MNGKHLKISAEHTSGGMFLLDAPMNNGTTLSRRRCWVPLAMPYKYLYHASIIFDNGPRQWPHLGVKLLQDGHAPPLPSRNLKTL